MSDTIFSAFSKYFRRVGSPGLSKQEEERNILKAKGPWQLVEWSPLQPGVPAARIADQCDQGSDFQARVLDNLASRDPSLPGTVPESAPHWVPHLMPKAQLLCTLVPNQISETEFRWSRLGQLCCQAREREPQWANALKTMCPRLGKIVRNFIVIVQRGHDQLLEVLLMGWW